MSDKEAKVAMAAEDANDNNGNWSDGGSITSTKDYGVFVMANWNRKVDQKDVDKMAQRMSSESESLGRLQPILVRIVDGKIAGTKGSALILDGQHRFLARKSLGWPIYCIVAREGDCSAKHVTKMNSHQKKWSTRDYIDSMVARNKEPYIWYKDLIAKYGLSDSFYRLMYTNHFDREAEDRAGIGSSVIDDIFKNGEFTPSQTLRDSVRSFCVDLDDASQSCGANKKLNKALYHGHMIRALLIIRKHPDFSMANLNHGLSTYGQMFSLKYMIADCVAELVAMYNYKRRSGKISVLWDASSREWIYN